MQSDFKLFKEATDIMDNHGYNYVVFGGIAVWAYGRQRLTKDIDLLFKPDEADGALLALLKNGWTTKRTDENWLYQATKDNAQVDLIFQAKGDFALTDEIISRARALNISGYEFKVISPEDLILIKIFAIKEIRPADWYDAISVLEGLKGDIDWKYFALKSLSSPDRVLSFLLFARSENEDYQIPVWIIEELSKEILNSQKAT
jgi:predicted nucleotidyltransferase